MLYFKKILITVKIINMIKIIFLAKIKIKS